MDIHQRLADRAELSDARRPAKLVAIPPPTNIKPADPSTATAADGGAFRATQWSLVLTAAGDDTRARAALERLCETYWFPLYAFARRSGLSSHDAEDATQTFFTHLLEKRALVAADPARGRFRSFLLASLKNSLSHERERAATQKRGGGRQFIAIDAHAAEERYAFEPADELSPDKLYDRRWALTVLDRAQTRLRTEYERAGKAKLFDAICPALGGSRAAAPTPSLPRASA